MDLTTRYLGMHLKNPLVPSASPLSRDLGTLQRMEEAGASAVVLYSLFEEEILIGDLALHDSLNAGAESYSEALSYLPEALYYQTGPEAYLEHLRRVKDQLSIPVIASLNGISTGGWIRYAREIEAVGADALELNMYYLPSDPHLSGSVVEEMYALLFGELRRTVTLPIAVKLSPFFSALPHMARRLAGAGAQGLVLFNRFYQPDLDIESLRTEPTLELSSSSELRLPLRWIALLFGNVAVDFALTTGVHTVEDVIKGLMAGASVTMMASELLQNGIQRIGEVLSELEVWLEVHEYESLTPLIGSMSVLRSGQSAAFERSNYISVLRSYLPDAELPASVEAP
jgi:dihydroorotate dehydrogenase (fumarate)